MRCEPATNGNWTKHFSFLFLPMSRVFSLQIIENRNIPAILPNYFGHLLYVKWWWLVPTMPRGWPRHWRPLGLRSWHWRHPVGKSLSWMWSSWWTSWWTSLQLQTPLYCSAWTTLHSLSKMRMALWRCRASPGATTSTICWGAEVGQQGTGQQLNEVAEAGAHVHQGRQGDAAHLSPKIPSRLVLCGPWPHGGQG